MPYDLSQSKEVSPPCDPEIFRAGRLVLMTHTIGSEQMEAWVKEVAAHSGQPVDWHYAGGRACVLALGDLDRVYEALEELMPEHDRLQTEAALEILPDCPFTPSSTRYAEDEINTAHEWVRGKPFQWVRIQPFHDHLDACAQCRDHPFGLCEVGASLLAEVV